MILTDKQIKELCIKDNPMVYPFIDEQVTKDDDGLKVLSYGLSSAGYDVRLSDEFKVFTNINNVIIDPLDFNDQSLVSVKKDICIIPPNSYVLGRTIETFDLPKNILALCVGKSTLARCGLIINNTCINPGFRGQVVIEIANCTSLPIKIYANQGIAQLLFFRSSEDCETSYKDKKGKYQDQTGITLPKA
jgi:dCTP deaminase